MKRAIQNTTSALLATIMLAGCGHRPEDVTNAEILEAINSQPTPVCEVVPLFPTAETTKMPTPTPTAELVSGETDILELADTAFPDQRTIQLKRVKVLKDSWLLVYKTVSAPKDPLAKHVLIYRGWLQAGDFGGVSLKIPQHDKDRPLDSGKISVLLFQDLGENQSYEPDLDPQSINEFGYPVAATAEIPDWGE